MKNEIKPSLDDIRAFLLDFPQFSGVMWRIRDKAGELVPFKFKRSQTLVWRAIKRQIDLGLPIRLLILKYRQAGISLFVTIFCLWWIGTHPGHNAISIANRQDLPAKWLARLRRLVEQWQQTVDIAPVTRTTNANEISFAEIDTRYAIGSSEGRTPGMGDTLQIVHCSEKPYWQHGDEVVAELIPAVPKKPNTGVIMESTGYAVGDEWYRDWHRALASNPNGDKNDYYAIFLPWFIDEEYTLDTPKKAVKWADLADLTPYEENLIALAGDYAASDNGKLCGFDGITPGQIAWRRAMLEGEFFGKEAWFPNKYPATVQEAFLSGGMNVFNLDHVTAANCTIRPFVERYDLHVDNAGDPAKNWKVLPNASGDLIVWEKPDERYHYVIGADNMWGKTDEVDFDVAFVECLETGKKVAKVKGQYDLAVWGRMLFALGMWYNKATLAPERNSKAATDLMPFLRGVYNSDWSYPNIYIRRDEVKLHAPFRAEDYGWYTDKPSKSKLILHAKISTLEGHYDWADQETVTQMQAYLMMPDGSMSAPDGMHDDDLMASMITTYVAHEMRLHTELYQAPTKGPAEYSPEWFAQREQQHKDDEDFFNGDDL